MTHALEAAADPKKPYGDVTYADPGYQSDGKKRYPLDSEEHCRAAWSYINQAGNAAKYTPAQLKRIKSRIKAAGRKYGIDFAEDKKVSAAAAITGVELARPGTWKLRSGEITVTPRMLDDAARFAAREDARPGYLKIGHIDGQPAASLGDLSNLRVEQDEDGEHVLLGDLVDLPDWLAAAAPTHWPNRSIEGWQDFEHDGEKYSLVVDGLALLGLEPPGIESLRGLPPAVSVTASGSGSARRIVASFGDPPTPGPAPEEPIRKGAGMDPAKIREALGLPPDASDDDVKAAGLAAFGVAAPSPDSATQGVAEPITASSQQELDQRIAAAAARGGVVTIDAAQVAQFQEGMVRAAALAKRLDEQDRDATITEAIRKGKFPPARRTHYEKAWDVDPAGTKELIASLAAGLVPVTASGYEGGGDDAVFDAEYRHLFPPAGKGR